MTELQDITNLTELNQNEAERTNKTSVKVRAPKRILHFSDGIMEEYSDDEDITDGKSNESQISVVSIQKMSNYAIVLFVCTKSITQYGMFNANRTMKTEFYDHF